MDTDTYRNAEVAAAQRAFVPVRLSIWQARDLARSWGVTGTPVTVLVTGDGELAARLRAYRGVADYIESLRVLTATWEKAKPTAARLKEKPDDLAAAKELAELSWQLDCVARARELAERVAQRGEREGASEEERRAAAECAVLLLDIAAHENRFASPNPNALLQLALRAQSLDPDGKFRTAAHTSAFEAYAWHLMREWGSARDAARKALEAHPSSPRADMMRYVLGMALHAGGKVEEAVAALREAAKDPSSRYGEKAAEALENIEKRK